jgi:predicted lipoprotein with Yx(FWY)xxD motif
MRCHMFRSVLLLVFVAGLGWGAAAGSASFRTGALVGAHKTSLGVVLVDARGRTLYLFERDARRVSSCYAKCAAIWVPLVTTARPTAGAGARVGLLGTTKRKDGRLQVTYAKHPLYTFMLDRAAGQTKGEGVNGFGGEWYAVSPMGAKIEQASSSTSQGSGSGSGGGGYGSGSGYDNYGG